MSTLPRDGFGGRGPGSRRKPLIIGGVVLVLIVVWSYFVLSYGGGEQTQSTAPQGGGVTARTTASAVPDDPAYAEGGSTNGGTGGGTGGSTDRTPSGDDNTEGQASSEDPGSEAGDADPSEPSSTVGAQQPQPQEQPVGASNEPGNYDPLGKDVSEGDLAPIDEKRLRFAAERYVSAAYGYSGSDKDDYNQGVGATVVWPDFFDSEGSSETERFAEQVEESGTKSGAVLTDFEPVEVLADRATTYAYFETGSGYKSDGSLTGQKQSYRQKMILVRTGSTWKVRAVEKIEEAN